MATIINNGIYELDHAEGVELLERQARRRLGMCAEEFMRAWDASDFDARDDCAVFEVALLLPFAR